jgi:hypothetical protein
MEQMRDKEATRHAGSWWDLGADATRPTAWRKRAKRGGITYV